MCYCTWARAAHTLAATGYPSLPRCECNAATRPPPCPQCQCNTLKRALPLTPNASISSRA